MKLDPYLGAITSQSALFEIEVSDIRRRVDEIAGKTAMLESLHNASGAMTRYDLRASAQSLREAADALDRLHDAMMPVRLHRSNR